MSVDEALVKSFRRDSKQRHNATGTIHRVTGQTLNTSTGVNVDTTASVYTGKLTLLPVPAQEQTPEYGGEDVNVRRYRVWVAEDTDVLPDDILTVTAGGFDSDLSGETLTCVDVEYSSWQVTRSLVFLHNRGA